MKIKYVFPPWRLTTSIKQLYNVCRLVTLLVSFLDTCIYTIYMYVHVLGGYDLCALHFQLGADRNTRTMYEIGGNFVIRIVGQWLFPYFW